jgi:hypothetical protein
MAAPQLSKHNPRLPVLVHLYHIRSRRRYVILTALLHSVVNDEVKVEHVMARRCAPLHHALEGCFLAHHSTRRLV